METCMQGGAFDFADDTINAWNIAKWNGTNWCNLCSSGGSFGTDRLNGNHGGAEILDMEVFNNKLYITGQFEKVCGIQSYLAYWDDTTWTGTSYPIWDGKKIVICNDRLYIKHLGGAWFSSFNETNFLSPIDSTFDSGLNDLTEFQGKLYISGAFDYSGNTAAFRIARLMVNPHVYVSLSVCSGSTYDFNGAMLTTPGVYTDTLMDASGLDSIITLTLSFVTINPTISISNDTLTATGNVTIQWYNCNTHAFINTQTGNTFVLTNTGSYAAIFINGNCIDTTDCITYTGVSNQSTVSSMQYAVFPNPTNENITITLNTNCVNCVLQVYNLLGEKMISHSIEKNKTEINVSVLASGVYFLKVSNEKWYEVQKFVKE